MEKLYNRIDWHNNTSPAINETNLNRMSKAVDDIDDRVVDIAGTVMETVPQIQEDLAEAQELLEDAEEISTHPPIIGQNGNWWVWDTNIDDYADSGVDAGVSLSIGSTTTLPAGSDATVTNTGTATDPVLNFGIPQGEAGQTGAGVPTGGTTGQVLAKASGTDYDTEWITPSGGSGGHTILNGSGTAMTQRGKLQFVGGNVSDDSSNDKTVVTVARELTQAQYDALSSAEKNNGTTYYITDAPSSYTGVPQSMIGDAWVLNHNYAVGDYSIDANGLYKNGTAHTSNATNRPSVNQSGYWTLVSVASEIKSLNSGLNNEPAEYPTLNSTNFNSGTVQYKIKNGYCTVSVIELSPKSTGLSKIIATGLPKSKYVNASIGVCIKADGQPNGCIFINLNDTTLYAHVLSASEKMWGSFVYPIE